MVSSVLIWSEQQAIRPHKLQSMQTVLLSPVPVSLSSSQPESILFHSIPCRAIVSAGMSCLKDKTERACQKEAALSILPLHYPGQAGPLTHHLRMSLKAPGVSLSI